MNRRLVVALSAAFMLTSCSDRGPIVDPLRPITDAPAGNYTTVEATDRWKLERSGDQDCVRLNVADRVSGCFGSITSDGFAMTAIVGGGRDPRFVVVVYVTPGASVRFYSSQSNGTEAPTTTVDNATVAVIELTNDEQPWGLQVLSNDGALLQAQSFLR